MVQVQRRPGVGSAEVQTPTYTQGGAERLGEVCPREAAVWTAGSSLELQETEGFERAL